MRKFSFGLIILLCPILLSPAAFSQEAKMGYVNMRKIFYEYEKTKEFNKRLEAEDEKAKKEIEKMSKKIRKLRDEIDLLSDEARLGREPELKKAMEELDGYRKGKIDGFLKEKDEMFQEIRKDIVNVAEGYAKKNEYNMILDEAVFIYSSKDYDITDDVLKELNKK